MELKINSNIDLLKISKEPNFKMFKHNGHICVIIRQSYNGTYCGYVGVKKSSGCYGKSYYTDANTYDNNGCLIINDLCYTEESINDIQIHGGLTYANNNLSCIDNIFGDEIWFFGFDCSHYNDMSLYDFYNNTEVIYRDYDYVYENVISLSNQLKEIEDKIK